MPVRAPDEGPSGEESSALPVVRQSINEDEAVEESHNPKLLRAVARKHKIESSKSLVAAYNRTTDREERAVLLGWLKKYDERRTECLKPKTVLEYAELAKINPRSAQEKGVLKNLLVVLRSRLCEGEFLHENAGVALYRALVHIDPSVYGGVAQLVVMARKLLNSLSPEPTLSSENFREYEATFVSLHQIFFLLNTTSRYGIYEVEKQEFRRTIAEKKKAMELSCKYYPVNFYFNVLQQAVERLELQDAPSHLTQARRGVIYGLCVCFGVLHFVKKLGKADIDPVAVEGTCRRCRAAIAKMGLWKKPWFDSFQNLMASMLKAAKNEDNIELFDSDYNTALEYQRKMKNGEDSKALRFGIIRQLGMLATEGVSENTCKEATEKLVALATTQEASYEGWNNDVDILIALLDGIHKLHSIGKCSEKTKEGLQVLHQLGESFAQEALAEWLDGESMENKARVRSRGGFEAEHKDLCITFGRDVGFVQPATIKSNKEDLKRTYLHDNFATVASLFGDESRKHVKNMKHHVVVYEEIFEKGKMESRDGVQGVIQGVERDEYQNRTRDQMRECYNKKMRATRPIALDDLFKRRSLNPGDPESEIRRVLLYGDPGSGKTCITKVMAHRWALREMAQAFDAVYVVPVRILNNAETRRPQWTRLEEAISQTCFSERKLISDYEDLISQLEDDLDEPSTLLVIDGLDEANDYANELLSTVWNRSCKVLFLSRPYNMKNTERRVDVQVECLGFNDRQLQHYIHTELPGDEAPRFINSLRDSAAMWEMAHIPVTAHILCSLSKEHGIDHEEDKRRASTFQIYKDMTNYIWKRFEEKPVARNVKKIELFEDLEKIAFETLREGQILFHERFVMRHATSKNAAKTFKESGLLLLVLEGQDYQFPHLTFQEYFAGIYVARCLRSEKQNEGEKARDFINKEKYNPKYEVTLSFAMNAFAEGQASEALQEMLSIVDTQPVEVLGVQHSMLRMRVLEAALGEADEENLKTIKSDKNVLELAEGAHKLVSAGQNNIPIRRIVDEKLKKCPRVLEEFTQILNDRVKEVKHLLVSTDKLAENDLDTIDGSLMLARHAPKCLNEITEFVLHHMNVERQQSQPLEVIARLEHIATEAPDVAREVLEMAMLEKECVNKDAYLRQQKTRTAARVLVEIPEIRVDVLSILNDNSYTVREESTKAIARVITVEPELARGALPPLRRGLNDHWRTVREESTKAIASVIEVVPEIAGDLLPTFERLCEDTDSAVRMEATKAIAKVIEVVPEIAGDLLPTLERLCENTDSGVRMEATKAIARVIEVEPHIAGDLLPILERLCENTDSGVRMEATKAISRVIEVEPHMAGDLLPILERLCENTDSAVRMEATKAISRVIEVAPTLAGDLLPILERLCENTDSAVRMEATKAIAKVIEVAPTLAGKLVPILERLCENTDSAVRMEATKAIAKVIEVAPTLAGDLLPTLERLCENTDSGVRKEARKAISRVIDMAPTLAGKLVPILERLCDDADSAVRKEATIAIARVIGVAPEIADKQLPIIKRLCDDADSSVREGATIAITRVIEVVPDAAGDLLSVYERFFSDRFTASLIDTTELIAVAIKAGPSIAGDLMSILQRLCEDTDSAVRLEATKSIARVIEVAPEIAGKQLPILERLCDNTDSSVREGATIAIAKVIEVAPEIAGKQLPILKRLCEDTDSAVRLEATKSIARVIEVAPEIAGKQLPILKRLCDNTDSSVREGATIAIARVNSMAPEIATKLMPILQRLCEDTDSSVREEATKAFVRVIEVLPEIAGELLYIFKRLFDSTEPALRKEATIAIVRIIEVAPRFAGKLVPVLERLCDDADSSVRDEATKSIVRIIEVAPRFAGKLVPILQRLCDHTDSSVREGATIAIARVIEVAPEIASDLLQILERLCENTDSFVREESPKAIVRVIEVAPNLAGDMLLILERLCDNTGTFVREEAAKIISRVIHMSPKITGKLLPILERLCEDTDSSVRMEALKAIVKIIEVAPDIVGELLPILNRLCENTDSSVREEATKSILRVAEVAELAPEIAGELLPILERLCGNRYSSVRMEATKVIARVIEAAPEIADKQLPILQRLCDNTDSSVRMEATKVIARVFEAAPEIAAEMLPMLEKACSDEASSVRMEATKVIARVFEAAPEIAAEMLPMLEKACSDEASSVRMEATKVIARVFEAAPEIAAEMLPMLEKACSDEASSVRMEATNALDSIEIHKTSPSGTTFLSSYKTGFWLLFARNTFTVSSCSTPGNVSLVLHKISSHNILEWGKKASDQYLGHLRQEFERRFPGLLKQIRLKE